MRQQFRDIFVNLYNPIFHFNLHALSNLFGSDKNNKHHYTQHYIQHFSHLRRKKIKLLEIGIGGYDNHLLGGASLRMWKKYFIKGFIFGIDIYDKSAIEEKRIKTFKCNQTDKIILGIELYKACLLP